MILGLSPFKVVSVSAVLYPRWPPLLKIEITSNGQNCSILSQKVPEFELHKHNLLFSIYYRIFYELWTFYYFDRLCKLEKRGDEIKKNLLLWNYWANLNQTLLRWFLDGPFQNSVRWSRLLTKMATKLKIEKRGNEILTPLLL